MFYDEFKMKGRFKMKFFKKFAAVLIAMAVFTVGNIGILPRDAVEDFMLSVSAADSDIVASGECGADGDNLTWTLYSERTLTISGKGEMSNWWDASFAPWSYYEKSILNIIVEKGVTTIGDKAFDDCYSLTSITIPDSVTSIGDYAFYNCNSLTSITIPDSVTSIGKYTFYLTPWLYEKREENPLVIVNGILIDGINCEGDVLIPEGVTSIGGSAFYGCNLTSIVIPDSVTSIGDYSFCDCKNLTSITIPDSVTSIGDYAFYSCDSLTSITIPDSVTSIGDDAFYRCESLTSITIPDRVTSIGDDAFYGCESLTSVTIPDSATTIGSGAFESCDNLTSITIPDSITNIGYGAFSRCKSLTSINVDSKNKYYISDEGVLFNKNKSILIQYPAGKTAEEFIIPDSVIIIRGYAFLYCDSLTSITIPDNVTSIGDDAFRNCDALANVYIGNNVTTIGYDAFYDCDALTDVCYSGTEEEWNSITIRSGNDRLFDSDVTIHYNSKMPEEDEVQEHINFYNANESNFLLSSNDLFYNLKNEAEKDEGALWYKILFDMDSIFELDDAYHQEMTVQTIMVELLCSEESIDNTYTSFLKGGEEGADNILDAVAYNPDEIIGIVNDYDVKGELKKVLSIKDRSSAEFLNAKKEWFQNSIDSLDLKKLETAMKDLGYIADLTDMVFEDAREFYNFYATSESYKAADQYMKDALGVLTAQMIVQASLSSNNLRTWAVAEECAKQYEKITNTNDKKYYEYTAELIKEDGLKFGEKAAKNSMIFIVNKCVETSFPQVAAALEIAGVTLKIGIKVFESITKIDERVLERDMYLNLLVFQDAATETVRHLANEMEKKQTTDSVKTFEYGFGFYKKILRMTTDHGIKYCTLKKADQSNIINMQVENSAVNLWECHGENTNLTIIKQGVAETFYKALLYWFRCPVNVEVQKDGLKVAEIKKENIVYYTDDVSVYLKTLHTTDSEYATKFLLIPENYDVVVTGFADGTMSFEKAIIENGTVIEISNIEEIPVTAGSVYNEVIEGNKTVALECDLDNNGVIDQTVNAIDEVDAMLGDVNNDGMVDSSDASLVLAEYAEIQTGGAGGFTDIQYKAADVNKDDVVDSSDASKILSYYAMVSTGKEPTWD